MKILLKSRKKCFDKNLKKNHGNNMTYIGKYFSAERLLTYYCTCSFIGSWS